MKAGAAILTVIALISVAGCDQIPESALLLAPSLERRQVESRRFEKIKETDLLAACAGVLQDLGFNLDESESRLGILTASKDRSAVDAGQIAGAVILAILLGVYIPTDDKQKIRATIVVMPSLNGTPDEFVVRATFQRIVWNTAKQVTKAEWVKDPDLYQGFFEKLSQSVFLEAHKI